jgi:hypothetical protein
MAILKIKMKTIMKRMRIMQIITKMKKVMKRIMKMSLIEKIVLRKI